MKKIILMIALFASMQLYAQQPKQPAAKAQPKPKTATQTQVKKPVAGQPQTKTVKVTKVSSKITPISGKKLMKEGDTIRTRTGLKVIFKKMIPEAKRPELGDLMSVHYVGTLLNGKVFDSSRDKGEPFEFPIGMGRVIAGWDEGIMMLAAGERATLIIPSHIGYGENDMGDIPPNSTLIFDVEIMGIKPNPDKKPISLEGMNVQKTATGLQYVMRSSGNGRKPKSGDQVSVHYIGKLANGLAFDNSYDRGRPHTFRLGKREVIAGWEEGIALLGVGDKALLIIPPSLGYGEQGVGPIPGNSTLYFEVELTDAKEIVAPKPFDITGKPSITTKSGLQYILVANGKGDSAKVGKQVKVHYTGYLANGKIFDSSIERGEPIAFTLGVGQVIKGWDEGIAMMKVGDKARLVIPPAIAYGEMGSHGSIPPNATLTFDVELMEAEK